MTVTRRALAKFVAAALPIAMTTAAPQSDTSEETRSAHEALRANAGQIAKVKIPMTTEPPFHFKA